MLAGRHRRARTDFAGRGRMTKLACIDLFCGAGGLTHGLRSEGVPVVVGIDVDPTCRHPFETNNGARFIKEDVSRIEPSVLKTLFGDADLRILAGCAPCQPFSTYAQRYDTVGLPGRLLLRPRGVADPFQEPGPHDRQRSARYSGEGHRSEHPEASRRRVQDEDVRPDRHTLRCLRPAVAFTG